MKLYYDHFPTGKFEEVAVWVDAEGAVHRITFLSARTPADLEEEARARGVTLVADAAICADARDQLVQYFEGERCSFELNLCPEGTVFQRAVWDELCRIPYGQTISYGELARRIDQPKASRAVGQANNRNPLPVVIPCHRVVGSDGRMIGFGCGLSVKERLLELESPEKTLFS